MLRKSIKATGPTLRVQARGQGRFTCTHYCKACQAAGNCGSPVRSIGPMLLQAQPQAKTSDFQADFYEITQQLEALKVKLESASAASGAPAAKPETTSTNSLGKLAQLRKQHAYAAYVCATAEHG